MTEHSPFSGTHADNDNDHQGILGGRCHTFIAQSTLMLDSKLGYHHDDPDNPLYVNCFNKPPIITNDIPDYPWPSPPPVNTGCYPLRATASTTLDPESPEGLQVSVNNDQACFPVLDIKLNTQPIIDQVLALFLPRVVLTSGGGTFDINVDQNGCCCDDMGYFYLGPPNNSGNSHPGEWCFPGKVGDCIGVLQNTDICTANISWPSIGIRWDNEPRNGVDGAACSLLEQDSYACLGSAAKRFMQPQVMGIGRVEVVPSELGGGYGVSMVSGGPGWGYNTVFSPVYNSIEAIPECDDGISDPGEPTRFVPGIADMGSFTGMPADFEVQRICKGTVVTVIAQRAYNAPSEWDIVDPQIGNLGYADYWDKLVMWFHVGNAMDPSCVVQSDFSELGGAVSGSEYYRSLEDNPPRVSPAVLAAINSKVKGGSPGGSLTSGGA